MLFPRWQRLIKVMGVVVEPSVGLKELLEESVRIVGKICCDLA
jgi:hypothetical protein